VLEAIKLVRGKT